MYVKFWVKWGFYRGEKSSKSHRNQLNSVYQVLNQLATVWHFDWREITGQYSNKIYKYSRIYKYQYSMMFEFYK